MKWRIAREPPGWELSQDGGIRTTWLSRMTMLSPARIRAATWSRVQRGEGRPITEPNWDSFTAPARRAIFRPPGSAQPPPTPNNRTQVPRLDESGTRTSFVAFAASARQRTTYPTGGTSASAAQATLRHSWSSISKPKLLLDARFVLRRGRRSVLCALVPPDCDHLDPSHRPSLDLPPEARSTN